MTGPPSALSIAKVVSYAADFPSAEAWWSASSSEVLGVTPDSAMTTAGDDRARGPAPLRRPIETLARAGPSFELEYRIRHGRTGRQIWVLDRGLGKFDGVGRLIGLSGVLIDMSGRMSAERRVSRGGCRAAGGHRRIHSRTRSSRKASAAPSPAGTRARNGCWATTADEMVGESVWKLIPNEGEDEELRILNTIRMGETIKPFESVRLHKSGRPIHVSISVSSPIRKRPGQCRRRIHDRPRRHRASRQNERLSENEARLRLALRSARAGAWDFDLVRRELHWSPEMFSLYGLDPGLGKPSRADLIERIAPGHRARAQKSFPGHASGWLLHAQFPNIAGWLGESGRRWQAT